MGLLTIELVLKSLHSLFPFPSALNFHEFPKAHVLQPAGPVLLKFRQQRVKGTRFASHSQNTWAAFG